MKLWKENRLDREYSLTQEQIAEQFMKHQLYQDFLAGLRLRRALLGFIGGPGLNSAMEDNPEKDLVAIEKIILSKVK